MTTKRIEDMSDDEISALSPEDFAALVDENATNATNDKNVNEQEEQEQEQESEQENDADNEADNAEQDAGNEKEAPNGAETGKGSGDQEDAGQEAEQAAAAKPGKEDAAKAEPADAKPNAAASATPADGDLKAFYAAITAPFKANGRDIQVGSAEEARQLMQMGANYNKKMQAMRPHLATLRTLENAKIGEAELNFLIDVHNGVPEAINKLVKDRGIDPMDLAPEKADGYKPGNHKASNAEVELDAVLHELQGSDGLAQTLNIVSKQWDADSRGVVAKHPQLLKLLNDHVESGFYEQIAAEVERERTFGRLSGLTDLEAYRQVGDAMAAKGAFASAKGSSPSDQRTTGAPAVVTPDPKKADDSKRNAQKRGVAPVKGKATATQNPDFNPLSLSDEDFMKQFSKKF